MILGELSTSRMQVVDAAFAKLDVAGRGSANYTKVKETFDGTKHPDVCNGKKTSE